ncbi:MAG: protein-L-isoaspartate O-methyltransferase [Flammeovirgaceae bacterium]|nr:protein-L-isoaspartate O-methyltransferase [Flammeovirgaceae bacterium]
MTLSCRSPWGELKAMWRRRNVHSNPSDEDLKQLQQVMVREQIAGRGITCKNTISAISAIPRHRFLPKEMHGIAYDDSPQSIGLGQTISQPYMVALMTSQFGHLPKGSRILEIGSGCGYQTAILVEMGFEVHAIEIIPELFEFSKNTLRALNLMPASLTLADGKRGKADSAPFDGIIAAACGASIPHLWTEQMADGALIVAPVEDENNQMLVRIQRINEEYFREDICGVRFVPLV